MNFCGESDRYRQSKRRRRQNDYSGESGRLSGGTGEKGIIDSVIQHFCCYSGKILEEFTHAELPWLKTRGDLSAGAHANDLISKEVIGDYFTAVKQKYKMLTPNDIENYAQDMFRKLNKV